MPAASGFTLIIGSKIYGSLLGQLLASGEIQFTAVSTLTNKPISFRVGGTGSGQMITRPFSFPVVNGVITADSSDIAPQLPDVTLTNPASIGYAVSVIDPNTGDNLLGPGYTIQPSGATFDFDTFVPSLGSMATVVSGPVGPQGPDGTEGVNIFPTSVTTNSLTEPGFTLSPLPSNGAGAVWAVADVAGNSPLSVSADGTVELPRAQTGAAIITPLELNTADIVGLAVADPDGNACFGVDSKGLIVGKLAKTPLPPTSQTGLHAGTLKPMFGLNVEVIVGESTGSGITAGPVVSTAQPLANVTFSDGVRNGSITSASLTVTALAGLTSFIPLVAHQDVCTDATVIAEDPAITSAVFGETSLNGICDRIASDLLTLGKKAVFLGSCNALPGATYGMICAASDPSAITLGNTTAGAIYAQLLQIVTAAVSVGRSSYGSVGVPSLTMVFGINDDDANSHAGNANFAANMVAYQAKAQADIQTITGQSATIPIVIMQPARWGVTGTTRAVSGLVTPVVAPQQLAICMQHPDKFLFSTPTYFLAAASDGIHFTADSERWLGEYYAETKLNYQLGLPLTALIPSTPLLLGKTIAVPFSVVNGPLVFDTTQVADTAGTLTGSKYGFEVWDASGTIVPVVSASIASDGATVLLELGSSPTGGSVGYGWSCPSGALSGPATGARGNLRDSNPTKSYYGYPNMYHWAPHFKFTLG